MAKVVWSRQAADDLVITTEYLARTSEAYAGWFANEVFRLLELAAAHPRVGGIVPEYQLDHLRERRIDSYRILYRVHRDAIKVVTIIHGARLLPPSSFELID